MRDLDAGASVIYITRLLFAGMYVWIAGTLALEPILPAKNVASAKDVCVNYHLRPSSMLTSGNKVPSADLSCPEDNVTLWSWCTFSFVDPIFKLASERTLNDTDIWSLSPYFLHRNIFRKYLEYRSRFPTHTLLRFLLASNSLDLILDISLELWSVIIGFVPPYSLQQILSALEDPSGTDRPKAYFWSLVTFIAHLSFAQKDLFKSWHTRRCYERTRGQLFCALHYKALKRQDVNGKVSHEEEGEQGSADLGRIVNLMQSA